MELKDLEKLMKVFEESDSREFKLDDGDFHLYLSKNKHHAPCFWWTNFVVELFIVSA